MICFEEIPDVERVQLHTYFCMIQYLLARVSAVPSAVSLKVELLNTKSLIDSLVYLSDEVPF